MARKYLKLHLLGGVAASALVLGLGISQASAFDDVHWTWDATVSESIAKDVAVNIKLKPTGLVTLEDMQVNVGDVTAASSVSNVQNNQPTGGGTADVGSVTLDAQYGLGGGWLNGTVTGSNVSGASLDTSQGGVNENDIPPDVNGEVTAVIDLGTVTIQPTASFDAVTELPGVVSSATAVANNASITADTPVEVHEGQYAFGGYNTDPSSLGVVAQALGAVIPTGNQAIDGLAAAAVSAQFGLITQGEISATSDVSDILNASVDSSATAVGNNKSITVAATVPDNALVLADLTQFNYNNVSSSSSVQNVSLNSYTNLGVLDHPVVNSVATSVGNNISVNVSSGQ